MTWTDPPPENDTISAAHLRAMREQHGVDSPEAHAAFDARLLEVLGEETAAPEVGLWWLSFVDVSLPEPPEELQVPGGPRWLGVVIVPALGMMDAVMATHAIGANPGGEVQGYGPIPFDEIHAKWHGRLLSKADIDVIEAEGRARSESS